MEMEINEKNFINKYENGMVFTPYELRMYLKKFNIIDKKINVRSYGATIVDNFFYVCKNKYKIPYQIDEKNNRILYLYQPRKIDEI